MSVRKTFGNSHCLINAQHVRINHKNLPLDLSELTLFILTMLIFGILDFLLVSSVTIFDLFALTITGST